MKAQEPDPEDFIPFDENNLAHQESPLALSDWQRWQDPTGAFSLAVEEDIAELEPKNL